jgi:DNA topoisomerase 2-associated protein PAT1
MLTLLTLLVACFGQLDVVRNASLLDNLEETPERAEVERQTNAFLASVMQSILPIVAKSNLRLITGLLGLLLDRSNIAAVARTKVGGCDLTNILMLMIFLAWIGAVDVVLEPRGSDQAEYCEWNPGHCRNTDD